MRGGREAEKETTKKRRRRNEEKEREGKRLPRQVCEEGNIRQSTVGHGGKIALVNSARMKKRQINLYKRRNVIVR